MDQAEIDDALAVTVGTDTDPAMSVDDEKMVSFNNGRQEGREAADKEWRERLGKVIKAACSFVCPDYENGFCDGMKKKPTCEFGLAVRHIESTMKGGERKDEKENGQRKGAGNSQGLRRYPEKR